MTGLPDCPLPFDPEARVTLGHGSGGALSHRLLQELIYAHFDDALLRQGHDCAVLPPGTGRLAFTTDSFVSGKNPGVPSALP